MRGFWLAAVATVATACWSYRSIEQDDGFRDVRLGSRPAEIAGMETVKEDGLGGAIWQRPSDAELVWGRAPISVRYHTWDDAIWKIEVRTGDSKALLPEITGEYGTPPFSTPWQWDAPTVRMNFKGTEYDSTAVVSIVKKPLESAREAAMPERRKQKAERDAAEKAARDAARAAEAAAPEAPSDEAAASP